MIYDVSEINYSLESELSDENFFHLQNRYSTIPLLFIVLVSISVY